MRHPPQRTGLLAGAEPCQPLPADVHPKRVVGGDIDIHPQVELAPVDQEGGANVPAAGAGVHVSGRPIGEPHIHMHVCT